MSPVIKLLDKARETCSPASDKALADSLHVVKSAVSNWRNGRAYPDAVACARIADMVGMPLHEVLGIVGEARAISRDEKAVWRRLAHAAVLVIATGPAVAAHFAYSGLVVLIMSRHSTLARFLARWRVTNRSDDHAQVLALQN